MHCLANFLSTLLVFTYLSCPATNNSAPVWQSNRHFGSFVAFIGVVVYVALII